MNLSITEIMVIVVVALVVIGPKRLPDVAKSVGKGYSEFKKAFNDLKKTVDLNDEDIPVRRDTNTQIAYKSRWEEQAAPPPQIEAQPEVDSTPIPPEKTEQTEPAKPRAKRGDLVKEDENGNG